MLHLYIQVHIGHVTAKLNERLESRISIAKFKTYYAEFCSYYLRSLLAFQTYPEFGNSASTWPVRFSLSSVYAQASDFHFSPSVQ